jgi:hypothetical protein
MQLEMSVVIGIISGSVPAAISFGMSMARITRLEKDEERGFQENKQTHDKLDALAHRLSRIEAKLENAK